MQPFTVAAFVMRGWPAAVALSARSAYAKKKQQQQQASHASQKQQQRMAAFPGVTGPIRKLFFLLISDKIA